MVQVLEKSQKELLIKFLEVAKKEKLEESKLKKEQIKVRKQKARKNENINNYKGKLDARNYGIAFRNY